MTLPVAVGDVDPRFLGGIVLVEGVDPDAPAPELDAAVAMLVARRREQEFPSAELKTAVRDLLRSRGYKPSGRGKPASEYLAGTARKDAFPRIGALVDAANLYSLLTGLPISLIDLDAARASGASLEIRTGVAGESYVFNGSGQEIELTGLICLAQVGGPPIANPVKDSLATRTGPETRNVLAVIYATSDAGPADIVERMAAQLGDQITRHAGGSVVASGVLSGETGVA